MKLNEGFPEWYAGKGVFSMLSKDTSLVWPWSDLSIEGDLDLDYHGNIAGGREICGLLKHFADTVPGSFPYLSDFDAVGALARARLSHAIHSQYGRRWGKLWETMYLEYNPIENYNMSENETISHTGQTSDTETGSDTTSVTQTDHSETDSTVDEDRTLAVTKSDSSTDTKAVQGFNSSTYSPSEQTSHTGTASEGDTDTVDRSDHSETDSSTISGTTGTSQKSSTGTSSDSTTRSFTRSGNLGVTTSQQMIESQRSLWMYRFFRDTVYPDLNSFLTVKIY